jgi:flagellar biosynthetic protein FliR
VDIFTVRMAAFVLLLARIAAFVMVLPILGSTTVPVRVRVGTALVLTLAFAAAMPPTVPAAGGQWLGMSLAMVRETLTGVALGLAVGIVFVAAGQAGRIMRRQMGLAIAEVYDPLTGEQGAPLGALLQMAFVLLFLAAGGHLLLLGLIDRSFAAFPVGTGPTAEAMMRGVLEAGSLMLEFALTLAAPILAAFLLLAIVLGIFARVVPEMNILFMSLPLRVGLGLLMTAAVLPSFRTFNGQLADWIRRFLT